MSLDPILTALLRDPLPLTTVLLPPGAGGIPAVPGLYTWWTVPAGLPTVAGPPHPTVPDLRLLYIGIAPSSTTSRSTLRSRVAGHHIRGNIRGSTLRRSLATLLAADLDLHPYFRDPKVCLPAVEEDQLRAWQHDHLRLTWAEHPTPWTVEAMVIAALTPPLNLEHNQGHPFYAPLSAARAAFRAQAQQGSGTPPSAPL